MSQSPFDEQLAPKARLAVAVDVAEAETVAVADAVALSVAVGSTDAVIAGAATSGVLDAVGEMVTVVVDGPWSHASAHVAIAAA